MKVSGSPPALFFLSTATQSIMMLIARNISLSLLAPGRVVIMYPRSSYHVAKCLNVLLTKETISSAAGQLDHRISLKLLTFSPLYIRSFSRPNASVAAGGSSWWFTSNVKYDLCDRGTHSYV